MSLLDLLPQMEYHGPSRILLEPDKYVPDTLDLLEDKEAREYWLNTFEKLVDKYVSYALMDKDDPTVEERALEFKACYVESIKKLRVNPLALGNLSVRLLLDVNETCLKSHGFSDLWKQQKKYENIEALSKLHQRLLEIDGIMDERQRWTQLCCGVLAGNMFDWGAQAVTAILEQNSYFGLQEALEKIQKRPWLYDGLDKWLDKLESSEYRCAAIFVDNSGIDIVLGMLPFVRALLLRGTEVILCANEWPALNDVTKTELEEILKGASAICPILETSLSNGALIVKSNGQGGPCLDLRTLSVGLNTEFGLRHVDLIVLEGMGRALHTNFNAQFAVDSLKLAVVKNAWLAQRLGGPLFSVIFRFEDKPTTHIT